MFKKISPSRVSGSIAPAPSPPAGGPVATSRSATTPSPIASSRGLSTLSSDLHLDGAVTGSGDLQIDGQVRGDVRVGRLIIGETGSIEGNVTADYVEVRGRIVGAVGGKQVKLTSTACLDGDITTEQLSIDIGAYFQGRVLPIRPTAPAVNAAELTPA